MRIATRTPVLPVAPGMHVFFCQAAPDSLKCRRHGRVKGPLLLGLTVSALSTVLFAAVAAVAVSDDGRNAFDDRVAEAMRQAGTTLPFLREVMVTATMLGGVPFLGGVATVGAVLLVRAGRRWLALTWCLIALGGGVLNSSLKLAFDRDRPPEVWQDPIVDEETKSFPSGHSMGSMIGYGLLGYMSTLSYRGRRRTWVFLAVLALLVPSIAFSRVFLRAHWCTDVLGGLLIGAAWLSLCLGIVEHRLRSLHRDAPLEPNGA